LHQLLKGTVAANLVNPAVEKMALSIQSTLSTYCKALNYLRPEGKIPYFRLNAGLKRKNKTAGYLSRAALRKWKP
jgi:hypothetical protein